ncbi:MAG: serine protease [Pseudomonadota bacterium]
MTFRIREFNDALFDAVSTFDQSKAEELSNELIDHIIERDDAYPVQEAAKALGLLRRRRYFVLMERVADALIQNGQRGPKVRRLYAQALIDQGRLTSAICVLERLKHDSDVGGACADPGEHAEALGLLGRSYKDLYINAANPQRSRHRAYLDSAIGYYKQVYDVNSEMAWHGINAVALLQRADRDGVDVRGIADPKRVAQSMASQVLAEMTNRLQMDTATRWDHATGLEACIALAKDEESLEWLGSYIGDRNTDDFELGSSYRQLTQVWQLKTSEPLGAKVLPALKAALLERKGGDIEIPVDEASHEGSGVLKLGEGFERRFGSDGFQTFSWFNRCMTRARSVAQILTDFDEAIGTGFLVRGGDLYEAWGDELLILTNAHVVCSDTTVSSAIRPQHARVTFELWKGGPQAFEVEELWTSRPDKLDATVLRPRVDLAGIEPVPVAGTLPARDGKQRAYVIGHPNGRKLSFSIHDNHLLDYDERLMHYRSPTEPGSSGSPVFNARWELIALHHRGLKKMPKLNGQEGTYPANEGIVIDAIVEALGTSSLS